MHGRRCNQSCSRTQARANQETQTSPETLHQQGGGNHHRGRSQHHDGHSQGRHRTVWRQLRPHQTRQGSQQNGRGLKQGLGRSQQANRFLFLPLHIDRHVCPWIAYQLVREK